MGSEIGNFDRRLAASALAGADEPGTDGLAVVGREIVADANAVQHNETMIVRGLLAGEAKEDVVVV